MHWYVQKNKEFKIITLGMAKTMIRKILLNNLIATCVYVILCGISYFVFFTPWGRPNKWIFLFTILYTLAILFVYYLIGKFILRNTHNVWANLASVIVFTVTMVIGIVFSLYEWVFVLLYLPFTPTITLIFYSEIPVAVSTIVVRGIMPFLPSLAMWLGMMTSKQT